MTPEQRPARPRESRRGRPPLDPQRLEFHETGLHAALVKILPETMISKERVDPAALAKALKVHKWTVYRWLGRNTISRKGARAIGVIRPDLDVMSLLAEFILA